MQEIMGSICGLGRLCGEGSGNPLQYSCLGNPMTRGAWLAKVYGVAKASHVTSWLNNSNKGTSLVIETRQNILQSIFYKSVNYKDIYMQYQLAIYIYLNILLPKVLCYCLYYYNSLSVLSHHLMGNRWGNSGNSVRLFLGGLQNHCRWWLQPWN